MDDRVDVVARLNSHDPEVVGRAALEAADAARLDAVPALLRLLDAGDPATMGPVAAALGELKAEEAGPRLLELLKDPRTRGRRGSLIYGLMGLDCRDRLHDVLDLTLDDSFEVRTKALMVLADIVEFQSIADLTAGLARLKDGLEDLAPGHEKQNEIQEAMDMVREEARRRMKRRRDRSDP